MDGPGKGRVGTVSALACAAILGTSCGSGSVDLFVDVRTDLLPGVEFAAVKVERFDGIPTADQSAAGSDSQMRTAFRADAFIDGVRVGAFPGVRKGVHVLRARLIDADAAVVLERVAHVTSRSDQVVTIVLTRSCRDVTCPGAGDPSAIACLGGECVDPRCTVETPEHCPEPTCRSAEDCGPATTPCASMVCASGGVCLARGNDGMCGTDEFCHPDNGCIPGPGTTGDADAASRPLDAASRPLDAASRPLDAASRPLDAGAPDADAGGSPFDVGVADSGAKDAMADGGASPPPCTPGFRDLGAVTACPYYCHTSQVAWDGTGYAVCWEQNQTADLASSSPLYCGFVDTEGAVVVPPFLVPPSSNARMPSLVHTGDSHFAIAFVDNRTGDHEVYLARFDRTGPTSDVRVTNAAGLAWGTSLTTAGANLGVTWFDSRDGDTTPDTFFATVGPADLGNPVQETRVTDLSVPAYSQSVAWTGTEYVLVWRDIRDDSTWDLYTARTDGTGSVYGEVPITVGAWSPRGTSLVQSGGEIALAFVNVDSTDTVYFSRLDLDPAIPTPVNSAIGARQSVRLVTLDPGGGYAVAWFDFRSGSAELYARFVDGSGTPLGPEIPLGGSPYFDSSGPDDPRPPGMTWNGRTVVLAWSDTRDGNAQIHLAEVCPN